MMGNVYSAQFAKNEFSPPRPMFAPPLRNSAPASGNFIPPRDGRQYGFLVTSMILAGAQNPSVKPMRGSLASERLPPPTCHP
jgi:hypothetical protein